MPKWTDGRTNKGAGQTDIENFDQAAWTSPHRATSADHASTPDHNVLLKKTGHPLSALCPWCGVGDAAFGEARTSISNWRLLNSVVDLPGHYPPLGAVSSEQLQPP